VGIILTRDNVANYTLAPECMNLMAGSIKKLPSDNAYDSNSFRNSLQKDGITPVIPGRANRKKRIRHDKEAYNGRNVIERCYCRLKDFRRIATRYEQTRQKLRFQCVPRCRSGLLDGKRCPAPTFQAG
jgi:transposase